MNYQNIYNQLIIKSQARGAVQGYYEKHHIIPKSLGGSSNKVNIVALTAREHFIAHYLLAKIHGGKMWYAVTRMRYQHAQKLQRITSKLYEIAKREHAMQTSIQKKGDARGAIAKWAKEGEHARESIRQRKIQKCIALQPGYKEKISIATKQGMARKNMTPDEISKRTLIAMQRPDVKAKHALGLQKYWAAKKGL